MTNRTEATKPYTDLFTSASSLSIRNFPAEALSPFQELNGTGSEQAKKDFPVHIQESHRQILGAARKALDRATDKPTKALIFGAGPAYDIPLKIIAEIFDQTTLVELDRTSTENAVRELDPAIQEKITIIGADVTGILGDYSQSIIELASSSTVIPFLKRTTTLTRDLQKKVEDKPPDFGSDYNFICSHLVLSQLGSEHYGFVERMLMRVFGQNAHIKTLSNQAVIDALGGQLLLTYADLTIAMQQEYIRYLFRSVAPNGVVHLADSYFKTYKGQKKAEATIDSEKIDPVIDAHFELMEDERKWVRTTSPGKFSHMIYASTLAPRK